MVISMETPSNIKKHAGDYNDRAWEEYSFAELGNFVHLLAKRSEHRSNPEKKKKGPSLMKTAKEYKGKADAEQQIIKHMTAGNKVKFEDGTEEDHKIIDTKDPKELSNLAKWILSH